MEAAFNVALSAVSADQESPFIANVVRTSPGDIAEAEKAMCTLLEVSAFEVLLKCNITKSISTYLSHQSFRYLITTYLLRITNSFCGSILIGTQLY